jgi:thioredoxin 1
MESDKDIVKKEEYDKDIVKKEEPDKDIVKKEIVEDTPNNVVVTDFMAEWCGPCKMQDPTIEELKIKFDGRVIFRKIDVDKDGELANKYKIMAVPTLIIEKDGIVFKQYVGLTKSKVLENTINDALKMTS